MSIRAVLFDVGGPLDTEIEHERLVDDALLASLRAEGLLLSPEALQAASDWAVSVFAPNAYAAMAWRLTGGNAAKTERVMVALAASGPARLASRGGIELRPAIEGVLRELHHRGLLLGLAANQPAAIVGELDRLGLGGLFAHRQVSGHHGYRKPDVRLFLRACEDLEVEPHECIMVGDRIDNDIAPARLLGMRTVLFRTGRHIAQQPRSPEDLPDAEVTTVEGLTAAIKSLVYRLSSTE